MENVDIKNKFAFGNTIYQMKGDTAPTENSGNFIDSNAVYNLYRSLSPYINKRFMTSHGISENFPTDEINSDEIIPSGRSVYLGYASLYNSGNYYLPYYNVVTNAFFKRDGLSATSGWEAINMPNVVSIITSDIGDFDTSSSKFRYRFKADASLPAGLTFEEGDYVMNFGDNATFNNEFAKGRILKITNVETTSGDRIRLTFTTELKQRIGNSVLCFDKISGKLFCLKGTEAANNRSVQYLT